ncbi:histidine phosphatase family protein [Roseovarius aestuariivivens]|uniref:histidine phosphatase family protein n=1 Tax=Roseovarius aestuariivivens TaxID=1888910 RepID=UPI001080FD33|nr:histidine phosphatase family protein [Roseovarius aestuariivivens]
MSDLLLVRHGQAMSHATDEAGYDRLSELGHVQAGWLGAHLRGAGHRFDRVVTGTLTRQQETARAMGLEITDIDPRLDELSYFALAGAMQTEHGIPAPRDATEFAMHLPQVITYWATGRLSGCPEPYDAFAARVTAAIDALTALSGRSLVVTSGGVIGMAIRHTLGLDEPNMAKIMLQILNSSMHRLHHVHGTLMLGGFNATPHLDAPDRAHARTFV